jgi:hypothetical protein
MVSVCGAPIDRERRHMNRLFWMAVAMGGCSSPYNGGAESTSYAQSAGGEPVQHADTAVRHDLVVEPLLLDFGTALPCGETEHKSFQLRNEGRERISAVPFASGSDSFLVEYDLFELMPGDEVSLGVAFVGMPDQQGEVAFIGMADSIADWRVTLLGSCSD